MIQTVWAVRDLPDPAARAPKASEEYTPLFLKLLARRGLQAPPQIEEFLYGSRASFLDPFLMKGVAEAVERLEKARVQGERVMIHGDYDVDGVTGAAILSLTLEKLKIPHETFLPERKRDGYGVSGEAIQKARERGVRLLVTVDCGITAGEEIRRAREIGIETIVLDHHQIPAAGLPPASAILNPLQEGCAYPFKELSAGGLAFKLSQALVGAEAFEFLDLATLSTIADLAPLRGENRCLVKEGLRRLSERKRLGIKALAESARLRAREINTLHVGFILAPRINASGRMSSAQTALRLLLTSNEREARSLAGILEEENRQRREEEKKVTNEAMAEVERSVNFSRDKVLVVAREGWHAGVIGIAAARLVERYHRPAFVVALEGEKGKGSARSVRSFHLFKALQAAREFLGEFGGHEQAAGFQVEARQIPGLRKQLNEHASQSYPPEAFLKSIEIDLEIFLSDLTPQFLRELQLFAPHGIGNPKPLFLTRGLTVKNSGTTPRSKSHMWVTDGKLIFEMAPSGRNPLAFDFEAGGHFDLVYTISERSWEGESRVILEAKDAKPAGL